MNDVQKLLHFIEENNLEKAQKIFSKLKRNGTDEEKYLLAENLFQLGFLEQAKELYELLLKSYPDENELKILLAEILIDLNQEEEAILYLNAIDKEDAFYPQALLVSADLYQVLGLFEVSEQKLIEAKKLLTDEPVIDFALGELYHSQGLFLKAVKYYKSLLELGHEEISGVFLPERMAEAYSASGAFEEAIPYYEKALQHHQDIDTLFGFAFTCYQAGFYKKAIKAFTDLKAMDHEFHSLYLYLAKAYEHEGELERSLATVKQGLTVDRFNKELFYYGGKVALKENKEELAETYIREALALDPGYLAAALTLNKLLIHQERYEEVLEVIEKINEEGEVDPQLRWDAAVSHNALEQYSNALKSYRLAYNDFKDNEKFLLEYGYFLREEGDIRAAVKVFRQLLEKDPTNEEIMIVLEQLEQDDIHF